MCGKLGSLSPPKCLDVIFLSLVFRMSNPIVMIRPSCVTATYSTITVKLCHTLLVIFSPNFIVYCSWENDKEIVPLRSKSEVREQTGFSKTHTAKNTHTHSQNGGESSQFSLEPRCKSTQTVVARKQQPSGLRARPRKKKGDSVLGTGEVMLFSYSAGLIGMSKKRR